MNCKETMDIIDNYLDENKDCYNEQELTEHIEQCRECLSAYEDIKDIKDELGNLEYLPLPEDFHDELTKKLVSAEKKNKKHIWTKYAAVAACAGIVFITGGYIKSGFSSYSKTGAAAGMDYNYSDLAGAAQEYSADTAEGAMVKSKVSADTGAYDESYSADTANNTESAVSAGIHGEKLVKNGYVSLSVDDYSKAEEDIKNYINQNNGYVQNSSSYSDYDPELNVSRGKSGSMTVCVESDKFSSAMEYIKTIGAVTDENEYTDDITSEYVDTESRLKVKEQEKERLTELMDRAESMEDIINIESRLSQVISDIESAKAQINNYDSLTSFSRININITERKLSDGTAVSTNFSEKVKYNFSNSVKNFGLFIQWAVLLFIGIWVPLVIVVVIIAAVIIFIKKRKNKKN